MRTQRWEGEWGIMGSSHFPEWQTRLWLGMFCQNEWGLSILSIRPKETEVWCHDMMATGISHSPTTYRVLRMRPDLAPRRSHLQGLGLCSMALPKHPLLKGIHTWMALPFCADLYFPLYFGITSFLRFVIESQHGHLRVNCVHKIHLVIQILAYISYRKSVPLVP